MGLTVSAKLLLVVRLPSLTVTVMVAVPVWLRAGVTVAVRLAPEPPKTMLAAGIKVGLEEAPETIRLPATVCTSPTVKAIGAVAVFWLVDRSAIFVNAGFPVNFDGRISTTPGRFIQATPVMMLGATVQGAEARTPGVLDLSPVLCEWLDREFREILGADAHLLVPPSEEAW